MQIMPTLIYTKEKALLDFIDRQEIDIMGVPEADIKFFDMTFFDLLDTLTSKVMLPLGGLMMAIFVGFIVKKNIVAAELSLSTFIFDSWRFILRFIAPIAVTLIFINGFT